MLSCAAFAAGSLPELSDKLEPVRELVPEKVRKVTLKEAIDIATRQNSSIRTSLYSDDSAENSYRTAWYNYYFPKLDFEYSKTHTTTRSEKAAEERENLDSLDLLVKGTVPWAGLKYSLKPVSLDHAQTNKKNESYTGNWSLNLELPLIRNIGPFIQTLTIRQAQLTRWVSRLSRDEAAVKAVNSLRSGYWDLLYASRSLEIQRISLRSAEDLVTQTRAKIRSGLLPEFEVYNALSNYYSVQTSLLKAQEDLLKNQEQFVKQLGFDPKTNDVWFSPLETEALREVELPALGLEQALKQALGNRHDYRTALSNLETSRMSARKAGNARLPSLSLIATIDDTGESRNTRWESQRRSYQRDQDEFTVGVKLTWTLPFLDEEWSYRSARNDVAVRDISVSQAAENIRAEVSNALSSLESSHRRVRSARLAAHLSERKLRAEVTKYRLGEAPQKTVIDFQRDLSVARLAELEAFVGFRKALIQLDSALGVAQAE